jgi:hypothetical protein
MAQSVLAQGPAYPLKGGVVQVGVSLEVQLKPGARDGVLKYTGPNNDRDPILLALPAPSVTSVRTNVNHNADVDLEGSVKCIGQANDRDPILVNIGGVSPTAVIIERLP